MQIKEPNNVFQITQDHGTMVDVLFERNLRLKVSLKLWQRNVGELLTYFLRYFHVVCSSLPPAMFLQPFVCLSNGERDNSKRRSRNLMTNLWNNEPWPKEKHTLWVFFKMSSKTDNS